MRVLALGLMTLMAGNASAQASAAPVTAKGNDRAYTLTLMCAVVATHFKNDADWLRSLDAAQKMGRVQGFSRKRVSDDIWKMTNALGSELKDNPNAMEENREVCRKLKLVG